jgi:hypothetical protein
VRALRIAGWVAFAVGALLVLLGGRWYAGLAWMAAGMLATAAAQLGSLLRGMRARAERIREVQARRSGGSDPP